MRPLQRLVGLVALVGAALALGQATAAPPAGAGEWQRIDNPAPVFGLDGRPHAAACSGFPGLDPSFKFWARRGASKNLVIFFDGGGACWDSLTCTFPIVPGLPGQVPQVYKATILPGDDPATFDGIFNASHPANPVRDWTFVHIPYCSGDVHTGSPPEGTPQGRTYPNFGHPVLPLPPTFTIRHGGFDNFMVVLDWIKRNVDDPKRILVAGSSAGGYGASVHTPWIERLYPHANVSVLADAAQGVTTTAFDVSTPGRGSWNPQLAPWVFGSDPTQVAGDDLLRLTAESSPRTRVAQFTTRIDQVQIGFYGAMLQGGYGPGGACSQVAAEPVRVAVDWNNQMLATLQSYSADLPNFRYYLAEGSYHTILRRPELYTEASAGQPFTAWLAALLKKGEGDGNAVSRQPPWENLACPGCLIPLPCP